MKKTILLFLLFFTFFSIFNFTKSIGIENENAEYTIGIVNTSNLNLRTGTDISFPTIDKLQKDDALKIYGKIGEWYIVQSKDNKVGVANSQYITLNTKIEDTEISGKNENYDLTVDENEVLSLINKKRIENNLSPLIVDDDIQNLARLKAKDLVENNYFSHYSKVYGSPFEMLKNNSIFYKTASENIAGNSDLEKAVNSWLESDSHRKNILSNDYNYTGIGVIDSITYGKIIVELFVGK